MRGRVLSRLVDTAIVALPFVGFHWFGESFELVAVAYLALIAFYAMNISYNVRGESYGAD